MSNRLYIFLLLLLRLTAVTKHFTLVTRWHFICVYGKHQCHFLEQQMND